MSKDKILKFIVFYIEIEIFEHLFEYTNNLSLLYSEIV